jgi:RNA polymerase sigma factor (sigma-70 family)
MPLFHSQPDKRSNEEVFFAYYPRLLEWATQITHGDREEAEDLVHDLYFRITRISRPIDQVELPEPYLFRILRNLYYSQMRRAGRDAINDLSLVDYDSVEQGLAAVDRRQLLVVRSHLRQLCRYACERKSTARFASILILRFFLGYYPSELMKILQCARSSIDKGLHTARNEARLHLERPGVLRSIAPSAAPLAAQSSEHQDTQGLFAELQQMIFDAVEGECFGRSALKQRYAGDGKLPSLTAGELSHLVSCKVCLDQVNTILQLPLLKDRSPEYGLDRDNPSGPTSGPTSGSGDAGGSGVTEMRKRSPKKSPPTHKLERRAREIFEHRPDRLQIAIDGEIRTSQKVTAENNELHLKLARKEEPSFIEIFSEQGFCLAYLDVEAPASSDQLEQVETVTLSDNRSLTLTVTFAAEVPIVHVIYRDPVMAEDADEDEYAEEAEHRNASGVPLLTAGSTARRNPFTRIAVWLSPLSSRIRQALPDMNPTLATAMVLAVCSVLFFFLWWHQPPQMTANALLVHAETWDAQHPNSTPGVIYQKVRITTPRRALERSLYRDAQGVRVPHRLPLSAADAQLKDRLAQAGVDWDAPLSASSYQEWHDHEHVRQDKITRAGSHLLKLTTTVPTGAVAQASLTVRDTDFHPVERTVELRDSGTIEIAELNYDVLPWSSARPDWFEPAGGVTGIGPRVEPSFSLPPTPLTDGQITEAELSAMLALQQLHADTDNRLQVIPRPNGVQVKGIVETDARKRELEARLDQIPHVIPSIFTFQEFERQASSRSGSSAAGTRLSMASDTEQSSPLEKFFLAKGETRDEMSRLADRVSDSSNTIDRDSRMLADLMKRFASDQQLTDAGRSTLAELIAEHKQNVLRALDDEEHSLAEAGLLSGSAKTSPDGATDLKEIAEQNRRLCEELVFGDDAGGRSAQEIVPELVRTIHQLHTSALQIPLLTSARAVAGKER